MDKYLVSQIFVVIATLVLSITYVIKSRRKILACLITYNLFYGIHYLLLNARTGSLMNLVSISRNVFFYYNNQKGKENGIGVLIIIYLITIGFGIYSYQDFYSLVSIASSLLSTYSVWQKDVKKYRYLAFIVSIGFLVYAIHINSLFAVITESFLLVIEIIGIILYLRETKKAKTATNV